MRKNPGECASLAEIREQVNAIDHEIIALLGKRLSYVRAAVTFKPTEESIRRPDHWSSFFAQRREWAQEMGYDPDVIEKVYQVLYDFTIKVQLDLHAASAKAAR